MIDIHRYSTFRLDYCPLNCKAQKCKHYGCNFTSVQNNYSIWRTLPLEIEAGNIITVKDEI